MGEKTERKSIIISLQCVGSSHPHKQSAMPLPALALGQLLLSLRLKDVSICTGIRSFPAHPSPAIPKYSPAAIPLVLELF